MREDSAGMVRPIFDTLPAAAGLSNADAFWLSQRHALALLPGRLAGGRVALPDQDYSERFILS